LVETHNKPARSSLGRCIRAITLVTSVATVGVAGAQVGPGGTALSTVQIARIALPSTVTIIALSASGDTLGFGSGFMVQSDGVVVTNYHVLAGASNAIVILSTRESFSRVRIINADSVRDIAILRIPSVGLPFLSPDARIPEVGGRVTVIGNPMGLRQTVSEGIVSATRVVDGSALVQISAPISHGSSGGPVINESGRAFAIATSYLEGGQQLNFATPLRYAIGLLSERIPERSVAQVFGSSRQSSSALGSSVSSSLPEPTTRPRADIGGTYWISQKLKGDGSLNGIRQDGILAASGLVGILAVATYMKSGNLGPTSVYIVDEFRSNSAGQVVLKAGGQTYDGYQTEKGVAVTGKWSSGEDSYALDLVAERQLLELSSSTGLYTAEVRTTSESSSYGTSTTDWTGKLAVGFAHDTVYVDLYLENTLGGNVTLTGRAPLRDHERFRITSRDGLTSLEGWVKDGSLAGDWIDRRKSGTTYSGRLMARRQ
jgi:S1-C subfamily serine protease